MFFLLDFSKNQDAFKELSFLTSSNKSVNKDSKEAAPIPFLSGLSTCYPHGPLQNYTVFHTTLHSNKPCSDSARHLIPDHVTLGLPWRSAPARSSKNLNAYSLEPRQVSGNKLKYWRHNVKVPRPLIPKEFSAVYHSFLHDFGLWPKRVDSRLRV